MSEQQKETPLEPQSNSPPKSHYFVQKYEDEEGNRICAYCGKKFKSNYPSKKYCCQECYYQATKTVKAIWFQKNKQRINEKRRKSYKKKPKRKPKYTFRDRKQVTVNRISYQKCIIIKRELVLKELMTFQIESKFNRREKGKIRYKRNDSKIKDPIRCEYIIKKLNELGLPFTKIEEVEIPEFYDVIPVSPLFYKMKDTPPEFS